MLSDKQTTSAQDTSSGNVHAGCLSVVIPLYNSAATIAALVDTVVGELNDMFQGLEIVLVNDGSKDDTHRCALLTVDKYPGIVKYYRLSRNFGEHNAVMCGLNQSTGDYVCIIDDDFQTPPREIHKLVTKLDEGHEVVYSYYAKKQHSLFRNLSSAFNNWVATLLFGKPKDLYLSSFKLMNRFLVDVVTRYKGPFPYIDSLILRSTDSIGTQLCEHEKRAVARSNYTIGKLFKLWLNMVTSISILPLKIASILGLVMTCIGLLLAVFFTLSWTLGGVFIHSSVPKGWASLIVTVVLFTGLQFAILGMLGEYLGRLYLTQNRSPQYLIRESTEGKPRKETDGDK
jgi:undecaprenyl-phosphate 4-deoxy-4-formamido-L-arabinose transferase